VETCPCGTPLPNRESSAWVGWISGTIRRRGRTGTLGEANTISCCPGCRILIVSRQEEIFAPRRERPVPRRWWNGSCPGCGRAGFPDEPKWATLRLVRARATGDAEVTLGLCPRCSVDVARPKSSVPAEKIPELSEDLTRPDR
jgi:uncharacterized protein with PIN domain